MTVLHHVYDIPSEDELAQLVGAATPHFALQIKARVASYLDRLPRDHPRRAELTRHLARLDGLARDGEDAATARPDLPPRPSLNPDGDPDAAGGGGVSRHGGTATDVGPAPDAGGAPIEGREPAS